MRLWRLTRKSPHFARVIGSQYATTQPRCEAAREARGSWMDMLSSRLPCMTSLTGLAVPRSGTRSAHGYAEIDHSKRYDIAVSMRLTCWLRLETH